MQNPDPNSNASPPQVGRWLIVAMGFFLISLSFLIASRRNQVDIDLFHQMSLARQFNEEGTFPLSDAFAYTPTVDPVVHHEWGTGAVAYAVIEQMRLKSNGLMAMKYLLVTLICIACCLAARLRGATWPLIVPCFAMATILGGQIGYTTIRAQLFTMAFLAIEFCILAIDWQGKKWWIIPWFILVVIWANMHAGILAGLGIFCFYTILRMGQPLFDKYLPSPSESSNVNELKSRGTSWHLVIVAAISIALLLANPYTTDLPIYLYHGSTLDRPLINEWQPLLSKVKDPGILTLLGTSFILALVGFKNTWRTRPFQVFVVLLTAYLALKHVRHLSIYAITWACIVPAGLAQSSIGKELTKIGNRLARPLAIFAAAAGIFCMAQAVQAKFWEMRVNTYSDAPKPSGVLYPVGAVDFLKESKFKGNVVVQFATGAFVSWNLYPDVKVSIDSRYEAAYPEGSIEASFDFYDAKEGWQETLESHDSDAVIIPYHKPVLELVGDLPGWHLIYKDPVYSVFSKHRPNSEPVIVDQTGFDWEF